MKTNNIKIFFLSAASFMLPNLSNAAILFEDNFDSHADWSPKTVGSINDNFPGSTASYDFNSSSDAYGTPANWSYFRATGIWWSPNYQETIQINNTAGHGIGSADGVGKSFLVYNEAHIGSSGDGWGADGILSKLFPQDYPEIYARIWLRTQSGWKWDDNDDTMIKMFRIKHFDRSGSIYLNFSGGNNAPVYLWDFKHSNTWGTRWVNTLLCDPQATVYNCSNNGVPGDGLFVAGDMNVEPNAPGVLADGVWHKLDFHVKMNTYNSNDSIWNSDGVYQFSYDGVMKENYSNLQWKRTGSTEDVGWNAVDLGGNAFNNYNDTWLDNYSYLVGDTVIFNSYNWVALQDHLSTKTGTSNRPGFGSTAYWQNTGLISGQKEQWYAIDDVVVSTTEIPLDYEIGNSDATAPAAPSGLNVE
ncbi:MAG: fibronectin type III protein [uncultured bacterium]|nr:MAG: fibronectin type III protein [uncultured bacterium]